jgi:hypothetical protein
MYCRHPLDELKNQKQGKKKNRHYCATPRSSTPPNSATLQCRLPSQVSVFNDIEKVVALVFVNEHKRSASDAFNCSYVLN